MVKFGIEKNELYQKYRRFDLAIIVGFLIVWASITLLTGQLLMMLAQLRYTLFSTESIVIAPQLDFWMVVGICLATAISLALVDWFVRAYWREDAGEYRTFYNKKYGFNAWRVIRFVKYGTFVAAIPLLWFSLNYYAVFGNEDVRISEFWSLSEKSYSYEEIVSVSKHEFIESSGGEMTYNPYYILQFNDGFQWSSRVDGFMNVGKEAAAANLALEKTGLELRRFGLE